MRGGGEARLHDMSKAEQAHVQICNWAASRFTMSSVCAMSQTRIAVPSLVLCFQMQRDRDAIRLACKPLTDFLARRSESCLLRLHVSFR